MVFSSIDLHAFGKQQGFLQVPYSHNLGGWANVMIPVITMATANSPTVLVIGGNHGDEYQGQIAALKLARQTELDQVQGRLIIVPSLNFLACKAATRLTPIDGTNMNRAFPGDQNGSITGQIAHFLTHVLFPMSDAVIDIHSGGRSMEFVPCAHMHLVSDLDQRRAMLDAMLAWNTDFGFLYTDIAGSGLLPVEAETQGKLVVTTELGGGEGISAAVHRIAQDGLHNVLTHIGVLKGMKKSRADLGKPPTILTQALDRSNYLLAPESGVFEAVVDLGSKVRREEPIGAIHFIERPDREPEWIFASNDGYLITLRVPCLTQQGDCVAVIAQPVSVSDILSA